MDTLNSVVEEVNANMALEMKLSSMPVEYTNLTSDVATNSPTDKLLTAGHKMLVDAGVCLKVSFDGRAMMGVENGMFTVQREINGDVVIISAPILSGKLNTTRILVGNYNSGEINIMREVARRPLVNTGRLTILYHNMEIVFQQYLKTLRGFARTKLLQEELDELYAELTAYQAAKQTRLRKLAVRELKSQIETLTLKRDASKRDC